MPRPADTLPMFHRRLLLLWSGMVVAFGVLTLQMLRLAVADGADYRARAESALDRTSLLPTYRGRILDRNGTVLAADRASYDIAVPFAVITGSWETRRAGRAARAEVGTTAWNEMTPEAQSEAVQRHRVAFERQTDALWRTFVEVGGLSEDELAARRDEIRARVHRIAADVWDTQRSKFQAERTERQGKREFRSQALVEHRQAHVILPRVTDDVAYAFRALARRFDDPLVEVRDAGRREYPWHEAIVTLDRTSLPTPLRSDQPLEIRLRGIADHLVGSVRPDVWQEDVQRRPFIHPETGVIDLGGYREGDRVGAAGLELFFEDHLRGRRGQIIERIDSEELRRIEAVPGHDLQITIDIMLQARVQAILSHEMGLTVVHPWHGGSRLPEGRKLDSAAVVLEIATGEILAMVSMPTLTDGREMSVLEQAIRQPEYNRPAEAIYPPGSILKPLVLASAFDREHYRLGETISCTGHFFPNNTKTLRCWIYREKYGLATHGELDAAEALGQSCNIFFCELATRLGMLPLAEELARFGVGQRLDIGLGPQLATADGDWRPAGTVAGRLPGRKDVDVLREEGRLKWARAAQGIGQGLLSWTPLHAVNAYATLARGGVSRDPTLLVSDPRESVSEGPPDVRLSPELQRTIMEGLRISVEEDRGTGNHITYPDTGQREPIINAPGVRVWAKTGTAQAPPMRWDVDNDGIFEKDTDRIRGLDHSWFVGMVGPAGGRRPLYVVAVIVEFGGSGGRVAGPVANQIIRALQAEHYLPGGGSP